MASQTHIIETFVAGKISAEACEDFLHVDSDFVAVVDGASDKTGTRVQGRAGGWIVANAIVDCLKDRSLCPADIAFDDWVSVTTDFIDARLREVGWPSDVQRPAASAIVFSAAHSEMWRVGDCHFRLDGVDHLGGKEFDDMVGGIRRDEILKAIEAGADIEALRTNDVGRAAILEMLQRQHLHANEDGSRFGYPVFNGMRVPPSLLERPISIPENSFVVMCSDGFDFPHETLDETISRQRISYEKDPLRIGTDGGRAGTKALAAEAARHDDQCFVSFLTTARAKPQDLRERAAWDRLLKRQARRRRLQRMLGISGIVDYFARRRLMKGFRKTERE